MVKPSVQELLRLPPQERLEIAQALWDSLEPEDEVQFVSIPQWQRRILQERLDDLASNPGDEQTWDEVRGEMRRGE